MSATSFKRGIASSYSKDRVLSIELGDLMYDIFSAHTTSFNISFLHANSIHAMKRGKISHFAIIISAVNQNISKNDKVRIFYRCIQLSIMLEHHLKGLLPSIIRRLRASHYGLTRMSLTS